MNFLKRHQQEYLSDTRICCLCLCIHTCLESLKPMFSFSFTSLWNARAFQRHRGPKGLFKIRTETVITVQQEFFIFKWTEMCSDLWVTVCLLSQTLPLMLWGGLKLEWLKCYSSNLCLFYKVLRLFIFILNSLAGSRRCTNSLKKRTVTSEDNHDGLDAIDVSAFSS